jgi:hypothetical protein
MVARDRPPTRANGARRPAERDRAWWRPAHEHRQRSCPLAGRGMPLGRTRQPARSANGSEPVGGGSPPPGGRTTHPTMRPPQGPSRAEAEARGERPAPTPVGASALVREREHRPRGGDPRTAGCRRPSPCCRPAALASGGDWAHERRSTCPHRAGATSTAAYRPVNAGSPWAMSGHGWIRPWSVRRGPLPAVRRASSVACRPYSEKDCHTRFTSWGPRLTAGS